MLNVFVYNPLPPIRDSYKYLPVKWVHCAPKHFL